MKILNKLFIYSLFLSTTQAVDSTGGDDPKQVQSNKQVFTNQVFIKTCFLTYDRLQEIALEKINKNKCSSYKELFDLLVGSLYELGKVNSGVAVSDMNQYGRSFFGKDTAALDVIEKYALGKKGDFHLLEVGPGYGLETLNLIHDLEKKGFFEDKNNKLFIRFVEINPANLPVLEALSTIIQGAFKNQVYIEKDILDDIRNVAIKKQFDVITFLNVYHYLSESSQKAAFSNMAGLIKGDGLLVGTVHTQKSDLNIGLNLKFSATLNNACNPIKGSAGFVKKNELNPGQTLTLDEFDKMKEGRTKEMDDHYGDILRALSFRKMNIKDVVEHVQVRPLVFIDQNEPEKESVFRLRTSIETACNGTGLSLYNEIKLDDKSFTFFMKKINKIIVAFMKITIGSS